MISNLSLSAFSATDLRPARTPPAAERAPVDVVAKPERVRAQAEAPRAQPLLSPGAPPSAQPPGKPMPRGSLLDLSV